MADVYICAFLNIITDTSFDIQQKINILQDCIGAGVDINMNNSEILFLAILNNEYIIVEFLIDSGINFRANNDEALMLACKREDINTIKLLISLGVDVSTQNNRAIQDCNNLDCVKLLVEHGADPFTSAELFSRCCLDKHVDIITYFMEINKNLLINDDRYIVIAFCYKSFEIKKLFLDNGANPNAIYSSGISLLNASIIDCKFEECKLLLEYGAEAILCKKHYTQNDFRFYNKISLRQIVDVCLEYGLDLRESMQNLI